MNVRGILFVFFDTHEEFCAWSYWNCMYLLFWALALWNPPPVVLFSSEVSSGRQHARGPSIKYSLGINVGQCVHIILNVKTSNV